MSLRPINHAALAVLLLTLCLTAPAHADVQRHLDAWFSTLEEMLPRLERRGYRFVTLAEVEL